MHPVHLAGPPISIDPSGLVHLLSHRDQEVVIAVLEASVRLCEEETGEQFVTSLWCAGGCQAVVRVFQAWGHVADVLEAALQCVTAMATRGHGRTWLGDAGACEAVVQGLTNGRGVRGVRVEGLRAVFALCTGDKANQASRMRP
jgi:hypothetical protein